MYRTLAVDSEGMWLRRPFTEEKPIVYGRSRDSQVSTGVGPAPSSDKRWVSYLRGDELRLVSASVSSTGGCSTWRHSVGETGTLR